MNLATTDHVVSRIEFRMVIDGREQVAIFMRPEKIAELMSDDRLTLGEWLRALRDAPEALP